MLKTMMLRRKIDLRKADLEKLRAKDAEFTQREADIEAAINEAETEDEQKAVEEEVEKFNAEKEEHEAAKGALETEVIPDLELPDLTVEVAELVLVAPEDLVAAPLRTLVIAEDLVPAVLETEPMPLLTFEPVVEIRGVWTLVPPPKWSCPHM